MKRLYKTHVKNKILLLIILSLAAGALILSPYNKDATNNVKHTISKTTDNNNIKINCETPKKELSRAVGEKNAKFAPDSCLYVGCNGFTY